MDVELRLLLYVVVLGCLVGVGTLVHRRSRDYHAYGLALVAVAAAATAGLLRKPVGEVVAWPAFTAWVLLAIVPSALVSSARGLSGDRRYTAAAALTALAAGLLLLARPVRREARLYAALAAADRGDEDACRAHLERISRFEGGRRSPETENLLALVPPVAARRWDDVLRAVEAMPRRTPLVVASEAAAAAETGDLSRALRATDELARILPAGMPIVAHSRRGLLAAGGRAAFLEEAVREELPVADGPPGAATLAIGRAYESAGQAEPAALAYRAAAAAAAGVLRRDAEEGLRRVESGGLRTAAPSEEEIAALRDLEHLCRTERPDPSRRPFFRRAPTTVAVCAVTAIAGGAVFAFVGHDVLALVAAGALSAPLVTRDGEWWRLASTMLLHGGVIHMVLNLASIWVIGFPFEERMGRVRTAIVYLASGLLASAASAFVTRTDVGVGASGAAMGIFGGLCTLLLLRPALFDPADRKQWLVACALVLLANAAIGAAEHEQIDNAAHAGGLVAGALLTWILLPPETDSPMHRGARRIVAASLVTVVIVSVGAVLRDLRDWTRESDVAAAGVRVRVPGWLPLRPEEGRGAIGARPPLPFAIQAGRHGPSSPDPHVLAARALGRPDDEARAWPGETVEDTDEEDLGIRVHRWPKRADDDAPGPETPLRVVVFSRGEAFAVVALPDDEEGDEAFGEAVWSVRRTLAADDEGSPR